MEMSKKERYLNRMVGTQKKCPQCKNNFIHQKGHLGGAFCSKKCTQRNREDIKNPWVNKTCQNKGCSNMFSVRSSNTIKKYCKEKNCTFQARKNNDAKYVNKKKTLRKATIKNEFIEKTPSNQIIDYKESPTGKAFIGFAKEPLMQNENGIGYQGVKIQTDNRELIQCYECGMWLSRINSRHLKRCSNLVNTKQYKEKYGLNYKTALIVKQKGFQEKKKIYMERAQNS